MFSNRTSGRIARRLAAAGACALAGASLAAPAAQADGNSAVEFAQIADGSARVTASTGYSGSRRLDITRNGALIATDTKTDWYLDLALPALLKGDVATLYRDGTLWGTATYDGMPTINADACTGRSTFTGSHGAGQSISAYVFNQSDYRLSNHADVVDGSPFTVTLAHPLTAGDYVTAFTSQALGDITAYESREIVVGACPAPPAPPAPPITPVTAPTDQQVLTALVAAVAKTGTALAKLDPADLASGKSSTLPFVFPEPGTVVIQLTAPAANATAASAAKAKQPVVVATGTKTVGAAGSAKVTLKVSKAGKKLLRHAKKVRLTLKATFTPKRAAKAQTSTTAVTLKHKAKKQHHKR